MNVYFDWVFHLSGWAALLTLTGMEVVLGIDNVLFLSLISSRLPEPSARWARMFGLLVAFAFRVACLFMITWLIALTNPLFTIFEHDVSWRDIVLVGAGLFLMAQATIEVHHEVESAHEEEERPKLPPAFGGVILNIAIMDLVFSFDSILTAIGMVRDMGIMIIAIVLAMLAMFLAAGAVAARFELPGSDRLLARGGRNRRRGAARVSLCCNGLFGGGRGPQHLGQDEAAGRRSPQFAVRSSPLRVTRWDARCFVSEL